MIEDEKIIDLFFNRSEKAIQELDIKYGKVCHKLSYNILNNKQDAEECVNDAYLGAWNAIPPTRPNPLLSYHLLLPVHRKQTAYKYTVALPELLQTFPLGDPPF